MNTSSKSRRRCSKFMLKLALLLLLGLFFAPIAAQNSTSTEAPTADATTAATDAPTEMPVSVSTDSPTAADTPAPTPAVTESPVVTSTPSPTTSPIASTPQPTVEVDDDDDDNVTPSPTPAPVSDPPTPSPVTLTQAPTVKDNGGGGGGNDTPAPTPTVSAEPVEDTMRGLSITFADVQDSLVDQDALNVWEDVTKVWFQESFNADTSRRRRRKLQANPAKVGISKMRTELNVIDSYASDNGFTIVYDQVIRYVSQFGPQNSESLARLPFSYPDTADIYRTELRQNVPGFASVSSFTEPLITSSAPTKSPGGNSSNASEDDGFWTLPVIIGIAVGGAVLLFLLFCLACVLCRPNKDSSGSTKPGTSLNSNSRYGASSNNKNNNSYGNAAYNQQYHQPAVAQINAMGSYDDVSTMDEPIIPNVITNASGDVYGDQSVATVDYDYSKAYGGGGNESVVSSVGGTLGDNTRFTGAEQMPRVALGAASYESEGDINNNRRLGGSNGNNNLREEIIEVLAPAGKLGVVIDTPDEGAPVVHAVKDSSVIADQIQVGDKLIAVDDEDVRSMTAIKVSKLISKKSANPTRKLTIKRQVFVDDD
ncbi:hypothetical protein MPSEU_001085600 [Mayamaea pseudoterrestris]|nr:hypothetical protein MPSEU_001085600 [Mayamaea pseudoterrestris]